MSTDDAKNYKIISYNNSLICRRPVPSCIFTFIILYIYQDICLVTTQSPTASGEYFSQSRDKQQCGDSGYPSCLSWRGARENEPWNKRRSTLHLAFTRSYDLLQLLKTHNFMYKTLKNNKFASFILRFHRIFSVITHLFSVDRVQNSNNWGLNSYSARPLRRFRW